MPPFYIVIRCLISRGLGQSAEGGERGVWGGWNNEFFLPLPSRLFVHLTPTSWVYFPLPQHSTVTKSMMVT